MAEAGWAVHFYEDCPYVELTPDGVGQAQTRFGPHYRSRERVRRRLAPDGPGLRARRKILGYHAHAERIWTWS